MRGPSEEARREARRRYESGESMNSIAASMKLRRETLRATAQREGWTVQPNEQTAEQFKRTIQKEAASNVVNLFTKKTEEKLEQSGVIDEQVDLITESLQAHGRISKMMLEYAEKMMIKAMAGQVYAGEKQSEADVFNSILTGVGRAVEKSREIAGLKAGQISATVSNDNDAGIVIEQRRLETVKIPVNELSK